MSQNAETPRRVSGAFQKNSAAGGRPAVTVAQSVTGTEVRSSPGWPPVRIPGRPGWWRHYINGQQVDLPHREPPQQGAQHGK